MKKPRTIFSCRECGHRAPKWMGKCPGCGMWNTIDEERAPTPAENHPAGENFGAFAEPEPIDSEDIENEKRLLTGIEEFDRALGGGIVSGTLVLIGGDPGIGKSTLMLQALQGLSESRLKTLYVSGEESVRQLKIRSRRICASSPNMLAVSEIDIHAVLNMIKKHKPGVVVIDSIQTMFSPDISSAPGSVSQVRESAMKLMLAAKRTNIPIFMVGHVTKEGMIAGPRLLEHMVDVVLYFEGDRSHAFRILRAVKNRFGATNEIGVFEMKEAGLAQVPNPSEAFLSERPFAASGSVVTASMEGARPILLEMQALVNKTGYSAPKRTVLGMDQNRIALLAAVMEKKLGMRLTGYDIFINIAGGVKVDEPAVDLACICAIASSFLDIPIDQGAAAFGEVGLTGEVRAVGHIETRIAEAKKMGFTVCLVPESNLKRMEKPKGIKVQGVKRAADIMRMLFRRRE